MRPENFIYFLTVCGFFIGLFFSVFSQEEPGMIFWSSIIISGAFYIIGLASSSFFIKYFDAKHGYNIRKENKEEYLDKIILLLEKRERYIQDSHNFIENLEREFLNKKDERLTVDNA